MKNFLGVDNYVKFIVDKILEHKKNDGKHVASKAAGAIEIGGVEYEVKIVLEPRKDKWLNFSESADFVNTEAQ